MALMPAAGRTGEPRVEAPPSNTATARIPLASDDEAWRFLPKAQKGAGQPLPSWARAIAGACPNHGGLARSRPDPANAEPAGAFAAG